MTEGPYYDGQVVNGHRYDAGSNSWVPMPAPAMPATTYAPPTKGRSPLPWVLGSLAAVMVVVLGIVAFAGTPTPKAPAAASPTTQSPKPSPTTPSATPTATKSAPPTSSAPARPTTWYPKGFSEVDSGIALRWVDKPKCPAYTSCVQALVIPRDGCANNLYVELSLEDKGGAVVGYTNELLGAIDPGQRARMTFELYQQDVASVEFSEVNCY